MASQKGHHDIVQTLLGVGADINITRSLVSGTCTLSHSSVVEMDSIIHHNIHRNFVHLKYTHVCEHVVVFYQCQ